MNAVRITSSCAGVGRSAAAGEGAKAQVPAPAAAFSASTSLETAKSRFLPNWTEFSISSRETMLAPSLLIAATILACCRSRFSAFAAPRGPLGVQEFTVIRLPARSV